MPAHHRRAVRAAPRGPTRGTVACRVQAQAHLGGVPVGQAPQRRGDVRVRGRDRTVPGLLGGGAVERGVAGAAHELGRLVDERGAARVGRRRRSASTCPTLAPSGQAMPSAGRGGAQLSHRLRRAARGIVRSSPMPPSSMMVAAAMPVSREICAFHSSTGSGARSTSRQPPPSGSSSCSGMRQVDGAAVEARARRSSRADLGQQRDRLGSVPGVRRRLHAGVVELGPAAHQGPLDAGRAVGRAVGVQVDGPQHGRRASVGQQAGRALATARPGAAAPCRRAGRWSAPRRQVSASSAPPGGTKARDVGDGVVDPVAAAGGGSRRMAWSRSREVAGSIVTNGMSVRSTVGRAALPRAAGGLVGLALRRERELRGQFQLAAQARRSRCGARGQVG